MAKTVLISGTVLKRSFSQRTDTVLFLNRHKTVFGEKRVCTMATLICVH